MGRLKDVVGGSNCVTQGGDLTCEGYLIGAADEIYRTFPWYKRMQVLYGGHPAVDCSAVAKSQTALDISVLQQDENRADSDDEVDAETTIPGARAIDASTDVDSTSPTTPVRQTKTPVKAPQSRHRTISDQLTEALVKANKNMDKSAQLRVETRAKTALELKQMELEHHQKMAEKQQAHELEMMRQQIILAQLQRSLLMSRHDA
ncbi:hypothetical protein AAF712_016039 [Marasmius tenuissimus]|uniref:Uncharacterized protein n=1 Tax=Marasmius tenuissimus TaxID=585030 RepID=A0ABR2Z6P8_9AGAR